MLIIGLTGSIGMGKSTAAERFKANGIAVFDADACVHELYAGKAVPLIEAAFPGTTQNGIVDRKKLMTALLRDESGFNRIEAIVHPLVREAEMAFLEAEQKRGAAMAVLEIPLLFETGADRLVDISIVVSASADEQRRRVLERPGMTAERFEEIVSRQMNDAEKRGRADIVVDTNAAIADTQAQIDSVIASLRDKRGSAFEAHWRSPQGKGQQ